MNNQVYVATEIGLYKGNLGSDPNNWQIPFTELEENVSSPIYLKVMNCIVIRITNYINMI